MELEERLVQGFARAAGRPADEALRQFVRRTLEIARFHVPGAVIDWSFRPVLEAASRVRIASTNVRWHDWERWSNRQQTSMRLGGLVGSLRLEGDLATFSTLLARAQQLHVGKGTTFGLGKLRIEPLD